MPIQYLSAIRQMSSEALILAAAVAAVTALLKKTLLKNARRFVRSALPFFLGIVFFTVYRMAVTMSFDPVTEELFATLSSGFACVLPQRYIPHSSNIIFRNRNPASVFARLSPSRRLCARKQTGGSGEGTL